MIRYDDWFNRRLREQRPGRPDPRPAEFAHWRGHPEGRRGGGEYDRDLRPPRRADYHHGGFVIGPGPDGSDIGFRPPGYVSGYRPRYRGW